MPKRSAGSAKSAAAAKQPKTKATRKQKQKFPNLSDEQKLFVEKALEGNNILIDACIGSGKTTSIQYLCNEIPETKKILYLTYNKLLKIDAKARIKNKNATVTNYHGFACWILRKNGMIPSFQDSIQMFLNGHVRVPHYDVLIIDEYQDLEEELAKMILIVKQQNPGIQLIAVGDMCQKIYDKTTLDVAAFMDRFLGQHLSMSFTNCYRISAKLAGDLSTAWDKAINGVNDNCQVSTMDIESVLAFLKDKNPKDILCLGATTGKMTQLLNDLEENYPDRFNKKTVYAKIHETDGGATQPNSKTAVFTTFDGCKGMERPICIVFDWTFSYWQARLKKDVDAKILRNIFCVAASRGKDRIIFVRDDNPRDRLVTPDDLRFPVQCTANTTGVLMDTMFDFKYKEDIEAAFARISVHRLRGTAGLLESAPPLAAADKSVIGLRDHDELIDLLPCIGMLEKLYFENYDLDTYINHCREVDSSIRSKLKKDISAMSQDEKILYMTRLRTGQDRYETQVSLPLVSEEEKDKLYGRIATRFPRNAEAQIRCGIPFFDERGELVLEASGLADVKKDNAVYSLLFVQEPSHVHFLVCACYMIALDLEQAYLWNVRNNTLYAVEVPDKQAFLDFVAIAITKGKLKGYYDNPVAPLADAQKETLADYAEFWRDPGSVSRAKAKAETTVATRAATEKKAHPEGHAEEKHSAAACSTRQYGSRSMQPEYHASDAQAIQTVGSTQAAKAKTSTGISAKVPPAKETPAAGKAPQTRISSEFVPAPTYKASANVWNKTGTTVMGRIKSIRQPAPGYLPVPSFDLIHLEGNELFPQTEENIAASLVGTAVDYMYRFSLWGDPRDAFKISLFGARCLERVYPGAVQDAENLLASICSLDDESIRSAVKLVGYDVCYRSDAAYYRPVKDADENTISNIREMVMRTNTFFEEYGPITKDGFRFDGGYTKTIVNGDGDFLTEDTLWDLKVSVSKPKVQDTLQILVYWRMGLHSVHPEYKSIKYLGLFNPRRNEAYRIPVSRIPRNIIYAVEKDVIGYEPEQCLA